MHPDASCRRFPQEVFESGFPCFVIVGDEQDSVVGELVGDEVEFAELFSGDVVGAEAGGGDSEDSVVMHMEVLDKQATLNSQLMTKT